MTTPNKFLRASWLGLCALAALSTRVALAAPPGLDGNDLQELEAAVQALLELHPPTDPDHGRVADGLLMAAGLRVLGGEIPMALSQVQSLLLEQRGVASGLPQQKTLSALAWLNDLQGRATLAQRARNESLALGTTDPVELERLRALLAAVDQHRGLATAVGSAAPAPRTWGRRASTEGEIATLQQLMTELEAAQAATNAVGVLNEESKGVSNPGTTVAAERSLEARFLPALQELQRRRTRLAGWIARGNTQAAAEVQSVITTLDELSGVTTTRLLLMRVELAAMTGKAAPAPAPKPAVKVKVPDWRVETDPEEGRGRGWGRDRDRGREGDRGGRGFHRGHGRGGRRGGDRVEDVFDESSLKEIEKALRTMIDQEDPSWVEGQGFLADGVLGLAAIYSILDKPDRGIDLAKALHKKLSARPAGLGKPVLGLLKIRLYTAFARVLAGRTTAAEADFKELETLVRELPRNAFLGFPVTARLYMQVANAMDDLPTGARFEALAQTMATGSPVKPVPYPIPGDAEPLPADQMQARIDRLDTIKATMDDVQDWLKKADELTAAGPPSLADRSKYAQGVVDRQKKLAGQRRWLTAFLGELDVSEDETIVAFRDDQRDELDKLRDLIQEMGRLFLARAFMVRVDCLSEP